MDGVSWERFTKFVAKLGRQGLVVGNVERGLADFFDNIRNREGFTRTGNAQECLVFKTSLEPRNKRSYRFWLVARWFKLGT